MSDGTLETIVSTIRGTFDVLTHKNCVDAEAGPSEVQAYTDLTVTNAEGFAAFNDAFMKQDVAAIMATMSSNPIFDAPNPQPGGTCFQGTVLVELVWKMVFAFGVSFTVEDAFMTGDRACVRWAAKRTVDGKEETLRGCDIFHLKDGKVAAKLTYSKADSFLGLPSF